MTMNKDVIELDGSIGGGQVLRTGLSLAMVCGLALHIKNIRAKRSRPGLMRQHLTAVLAAAEICGAVVDGAELGSQELLFAPGPIKGGNYRFAIGTAGSCTLVLQTLLPALLRAAEPSTVHISGGTHNPLAPPFDFLQDAWLPLLRRMGAQVELQLLRHGFVPAGGGELAAFIQPSRLQPLDLLERGALLRQEARALLAGVPGSVAERELERVGKRLAIETSGRNIVWLDAEQGPGNALLLQFDCEALTEVFCAFGQSGVRAEAVADRAVEQARAWLQSTAAVAEHLADQLLLPMALAGGGSFTTLRMTEHIHSNIAVIETVLPVRFECQKQGKRMLIRCIHLEHQQHRG
jgi:RNA 3'-terminal phosphate cyclase (ATP)